MSVYKDHKRGTWEFWTEVTKPDGSRGQMHRRGFATKKAAEKAEAIIVADQARGAFVRPSRVTLKAYLLDEWLPVKARTLKPSTAASYRQMIGACIVPTLGSVPLGKIDGPTLNALYTHLLSSGRTGASGRAGGLSAKSVRNVHGLLHRAFKDAVRWRRLLVNPCDSADQPKLATPEMKVWTGVELDRFVTAASEDRLAAVWRLLALTGMRRGELLGLRWSDVNLDARTIRVTQTMTMAGDRPEIGTPKTAAGARPIALDVGTATALRTWRVRQTEERLMMGSGWQGGDDLLVTEPDGSPIHPQVFTRRFKAIAKAAGLSTIRLHDVRHSYATASLAAGVAPKVLSARLGHAHITTTLAIYAHVLPGDDAAAAEATAAAVLGNSVTTSLPRP